MGWGSKSQSNSKSNSNGNLEEWAGGKVLRESPEAMAGYPEETQTTGVLLGVEGVVHGEVPKGWLVWLLWLCM